MELPKAMHCMTIDQRSRWDRLAVGMCQCTGSSNLPVGSARELGLEADNNPAHCSQWSSEEAGRLSQGAKQTALLE